MNSLAEREKAVAALLAPVREALTRTHEQIARIEKERAESFGALRASLESVALGQQVLQRETSKLVSALRRPEVRGQWGELTLKRLAELAGMVEHCDFYQQENLDTDQGRMRPDMIVRLPGGRVIVVDVKTPLDAYLNAVEAGDDETRRKQLEHHARKVRERVRELASKNYWSQFEAAPDFVVLFIPGDQFLSAALDHDRELLEDALRQKVILATPTSFVALLRAVAYGWRQGQLAENTQRIRELGEDLYNRLATFSEHLVRSAALESVNDYNKAVGSFETKVLPGARKFTELGCAPKTRDRRDRAGRETDAGARRHAGRLILPTDHEFRSYVATPEVLLTERVILVTGASGGLGGALATACGVLGARLALRGSERSRSSKPSTTRSSQPAARARRSRRSISSARTPATTPRSPMACATSSAGSTASCMRRARSASEPRSRPLRRRHLDEGDARQRQCGVHPDAGVAAAASSLSEDASVIFTTSGVSVRGRAYWGAYAVSKFACEGLMQVFADETDTTTHIRANSVNPGKMRTPMRAMAFPGEDAATVPLPAIVLPTYLYLLGSASAGITGRRFDAQGARPDAPERAT